MSEETVPEYEFSEQELNNMVILNLNRIISKSVKEIGIKGAALAKRGMMGDAPSIKDLQNFIVDVMRINVDVSEISLLIHKMIYVRPEPVDADAKAAMLKQIDNHPVIKEAQALISESMEVKVTRKLLNKLSHHND